MEAPSAFDLNLSIQQWRENVALSPAFRRENLDELEAHLSDSIARLQASGLSDHEAFLIATRRMGQASALEGEFAKVNRRHVWLDRALWMLIGVQIWGLVTGLTGTVVRNATTWGCVSIGYDVTKFGPVLPTAAFGITQLLAFVLSLLCCWWLLVRKGKKWGEWLTPLLLQRSSLIWVCVSLCLCSLIVSALGYGAQALLFKFVSPSAYGTATLYQAYSHLFTWPVQVVAMMALTLGIARHQARARRRLVAARH